MLNIRTRYSLKFGQVVRSYSGENITVNNQEKQLKKRNLSKNEFDKRHLETSS